MGGRQVSNLVGRETRFLCHPEPVEGWASVEDLGRQRPRPTSITHLESYYFGLYLHPTLSLFSLRFGSGGSP